MTASEYAIQYNAEQAAWVAEDPANRWSGTLAEEPEHWAEYGIFTAEQLMDYLDACDAKWTTDADRNYFDSLENA